MNPILKKTILAVFLLSLSGCDNFEFVERTSNINKSPNLNCISKAIETVEGIKIEGKLNPSYNEKYGNIIGGFNYYDDNVKKLRPFSIWFEKKALDSNSYTHVGKSYIGGSFFRDDSLERKITIKELSDTMDKVEYKIQDMCDFKIKNR